MMRLSQAGRKLNVGIQTVVEILGSKGHRIENNPNAKLSFDQLEILSKELKAPELLSDMLGADKPADAKVENTRLQSDDILYFREEPEVLPEKIKIEHNLNGPKILGKIDLSGKSGNKILPIDESFEKPAPAVIKEIPKPIAVTAPVVIEKPVVLETPIIVEKPVAVEPPKPEPVPEPIVAVEAKIEEKIIEKVIEPIIEKKKEETPVAITPPIVVPVVKAPAESIEEEEVIKAQGDKLQGLKVLGKIELPVEKKPLTREELKAKRKRKRVLVGGEKVADTTKPSFDNFRRDRPAGTGNGPGQVRTPFPGNKNLPNAGNNSGTNTPYRGTPSSSNTGTTPPQSTAGASTAKPGEKNFRNDNKKGGKTGGFTNVDVKSSIKNTMTKMQGKGNDFGSKYRKEKRKTRAEQQEAQDQHELEQSGILKVTEYLSASELSSMMNVSVNAVIGSCMKMGIFASINQRLDAETIQLLALEYGFDVEFVSAEEETDTEALDIVDNLEDLQTRAPIVTIMGHVDHGKTSLLDYIRRTKVVSGEAGGITQHIGAYSVKMTEGTNKGKSITFLDTPGHEAFTAMRARGAKVTDVVIIVISADDSVMPQTKEAINHAQNAGVPIVFAFNKIDKPNANAAKIREDLSKENILVESWGGKYQEQEVSAKSGLGIDELLDKVLLESEILELKANPNRNAVGTVIEAQLDKGRGYVSTILIQAGTLKVGDIMLAGQHFGRVRALVNDLGERINEAGPSSPVQILGLPGAPQAGDKFNIMETEREAREIANKREQLNREMSIRAKKHITLDEIGRRKAIGTFKELNIIVKGDVDGSVEALSDSLLKLSTEEVQVRIIHKAVGQISESDVTLASAADAIVLGFQVRPSVNASKIAEAEQIEIRLYSIIYDAINEIRDAMEGLLAPKEEEVITGTIEIREVFKISKLGTVAGCYVTDGNVKRNNKVRIIREGIVVHTGEIAQLKRFKDDVQEVKNGYECGLSIKNYNNIEVADIIESFEIRELKRKL